MRRRPRIVASNSPEACLNNANNTVIKSRACHGWGKSSLVSQRRGPVSIPVQPMWIQRYWNWFFPQSFSFHLLVPFHQCYILICLSSTLYSLRTDSTVEISRLKKERNAGRGRYSLFTFFILKVSGFSKHSQRIMTITRCNFHLKYKMKRPLIHEIRLSYWICILHIKFKVAWGNVSNVGSFGCRGT